MSNAPHVHSVEETMANIKRIEHNSSGQGPGPSGKMGGAPTGIEAGSGANENTGGSTDKNPRSKGADWVNGSSD